MATARARLSLVAVALEPPIEAVSLGFGAARSGVALAWRRRT